MSIVVTCECTMKYRLPDKYAGKRCRCRECGERIEVPARAADERARRRRRKAERGAHATTRRLGGSADREILREGHALRQALGNRHVGESMHQLAPLHSGSREEDALAAVSARLASVDERRRASADEGRRASADERRAKRRARRAAEAEAERPARAERKGKSKQEPTPKGKGKSKSKGKGSAPKGAKGSAAKVAARESAAGGKTGKSAKTGKARGAGRTSSGERRALGAGAARRARLGRPAREGEERPAGLSRGATALIVGLVGALALAIGLAVGGVFGKPGAGAGLDVDAKLAYLEGLKQHGHWEQAKTEADALEAALQASGDTAALGRLYQARAGVDKVMALSALPQDADETRLRHLLEFAADRDPTVRMAAANDLAKLAGQEEAIRTLLALSRDADPRVADAGRRGAIHAGGPLVAPLLEQVIRETGATGGKLGEVAMERALELAEPAAVPALVAILETRTSGPPALLTSALRRLAELAQDGAVLAAVQPYLDHADAEVSAAARDVRDVLGG